MNPTKIRELAAGMHADSEVRQALEEGAAAIVRAVELKVQCDNLERVILRYNTQLESLQQLGNVAVDADPSALATALAANAAPPRDPGS